VFHENTSYIIVGEGPERARLEQYSDNVRASSQVFLVGERTDVAQILPHASVLWNGSLYEGQSNVILEAMQTGVPVIASDIPGNRDLVHHRNTGLLFPVGDVDTLARQTNELLRDDSLRATLASQAQHFVRTNHSLENMVSSHTRLYQQWMKERQ
jgi:glycosyltransferase involved in cell wall biosynthesis